LRLFLLTSFILSLVISVHGQTLKGIVLDAETTKPLYPVTIVNLTTEQSTTSGESGYFELPAKNGDGISFSFLGYHTEQRVANPGMELKMELYPLSVQLKEYILHPDYTPFQKDSAAMATLYSTELNKKPVKVGFSNANGGGFTGLIGAPVQKMSKSYKQNKKFRENFQRDIEQKYIDTRYTPGLVSALTGFAGDTLAIFMNSYPMEYNFARAASDLEIKVWIRNNYREYLKPQTNIKSGSDSRENNR
jgi:carboxypeptidase-like protein